MSTWVGPRYENGIARISYRYQPRAYLYHLVRSILVVVCSMSTLEDFRPSITEVWHRVSRGYGTWVLNRCDTCVSPVHWIGVDWNGDTGLLGSNLTHGETHISYPKRGRKVTQKSATVFGILTTIFQRSLPLSFYSWGSQGFPQLVFRLLACSKRSPYINCHYILYAWLCTE